MLIKAGFGISCFPYYVLELLSWHGAFIKFAFGKTAFGFIALYKEAKEHMTEELLQRLVKEVTYSPLMVKAKAMEQGTIREYLPEVWTFM